MRGVALLLSGSSSPRSPRPRVSSPSPVLALLCPPPLIRIMAARAWSAALLLLLAAGEMGTAAALPVVCPRVSTAESVLGRPASCSALDSPMLDDDPIGVVEGDEVTLQKSLNLVHQNMEEYTALLFYASWCPFSNICRPNFQTLSSLFPMIRHFAFEESVIRPSILSRYGVHGFPTLFLLNSTMRVRYHGSRNVNSLVAFYNDITGVNPGSLDALSTEQSVELSNAPEVKEDTEQENCPFSWARSPEKLLHQDTYLALASSFVLLRVLAFFLPKLHACVMWAWRRHIRFASLMDLGIICSPILSKQSWDPKC